MSHAEDETIDILASMTAQPGLGNGFSLYCCEALGVCLDKHGHASACTLHVDFEGAKTKRIAVPSVDQAARNSSADPEEATEHAAYGVACAMIPKLTDFVVIERSRKGGGFDFWLGATEEEHPFQNKARMEVSGILNGDESSIKSRLTTKVKQMKPSAGVGTGFAVVVEMSKPTIGIRKA